MMNKIENYISTFPETTRERLNMLYIIIKSEASDAKESISYGMPAFKLNKKPLVYFAGYKNHIGFYATPTGHEAFSKELSNYKQGKGSVQFPLDEPLPEDLIRRIVAFRVDENREK
ncbi:MAG TPA: DUF1801 domain-containing protein [Aquaticitalea sp.]|nr:DUF1801 domain-containing protein [Aquaticitalea sp.]